MSEFASPRTGSRLGYQRGLSSGRSVGPGVLWDVPHPARRIIEWFEKYLPRTVFRVQNDSEAVLRIEREILWWALIAAHKCAEGVDIQICVTVWPDNLPV